MSMLNDWAEKGLPMPTAREVEAFALSVDCTVVRADRYHLQLDLDDDEAYRHFLRTLPMVQRHFPMEIEQEWISRSGQGRHIVLKMDAPWTPTVRILLQACLGSDRVRELLNLVQYQNGEMDAILLYKPNPKALPPADEL